jgi:hypothetical protein
MTDGRNSQLPGPETQSATLRSRQTAILALAVAAPVALATAAILTFSALELRGETPLSYGPMRNVAEAAALGHASEVLRLLAAGQDPNHIWTVREEMLSSTITRVTALEAAIWSRRAQLIALLDRLGAVADEDTRRHLACLARDLESPAEIVDHLSRHQRSVDCPPGRALAAVRMRTE